MKWNYCKFDIVLQKLSKRLLLVCFFLIHMIFKINAATYILISRLDSFVLLNI